MNETEYKNKLKDKLIIYRSSLNLPSDVTFGVEIEYENIVKDTVTFLLEEEKKYCPNLIGWQNQSELDIAEYNELGEEVNGEITSKILIDRPSTWKSLTTVLNLLDRNGAIITNKCGAHVNIGAHILGNNKKHWRNFFLLWLLYEDIIYDFSKGEFLKIRTRDDSIIENISSSLDINKILNLRKRNYLNNLDDNLFHKYHDIHVSKLVCNKIITGNRIEFRIPNGTLKEEIWQNYINFFAKFVLASKKELDVEKTLYKIKHNDCSSVELADYIFDEEIDKDNFLIQTLKTNKIYKKQLTKHIDYY